MRQRQVYGLWSGVLALLAFQRPSAAAESPNCTVTKLPDGAFRYQLSGQPSSPPCTTSWEDDNRLVIVRDSHFNETLVTNLTERSVDLNHCLDHLRHTTQCQQADGEVEDHTDCRVNCSRFPMEPPVQSDHCVFKGWCPDRLTGDLIIGALVGVIILALILWPVIYTYRRRRKLYDPPPDQNTVEMSSALTKTPVTV